MIKIGIHRRNGSFSDRWIEYCVKNNIDYIILDCYSSMIINTLKDEKITHLMWHINHEISKDLMVYPYVMNAADNMGIKTFPDFNTRWHFDDKVAQKYLFESKGINSIKSDVFYDQQEAITFLKSRKLPIVAKLKRGAGSTNVQLIKSERAGLEYIESLFTTGIMSTAKPLENFRQKSRLAKKIRNPFKLISKVYNFYKKNKTERTLSNPEKGYVYFQEFLPNNSSDTRIIVIGDIAFGIRRFNNDNDFRASGSGKIDYNIEEIDMNIVKNAFLISEKLNLQCAAYDFVYDENKNPKVIEVCFGFSMLSYDKCEGYWRKDLSFVKGPFNPQEFMIKDFINVK